MGDRWGGDGHSSEWSCGRPAPVGRGSARRRLPPELADADSGHPPSRLQCSLHQTQRQNQRRPSGPADPGKRLQGARGVCWWFCVAPKPSLAASANAPFALRELTLPQGWWAEFTAWCGGWRL